MSDYVDINRAAKHLGVEVSWLYKQCMAGTIPFYKVGKYNRFNIAELDRHLVENCRRGPIPGECPMRANKPERQILMDRPVRAHLMDR